MTADNELHYGDNLDVLRRHTKDQSIDLVYLDLPYQSSQEYDAGFAEEGGAIATAQWTAAGANPSRNPVSPGGRNATIEVNATVFERLQALRVLLDGGDMFAYLAALAPRLVELHRVLRQTGSLYVQCNPKVAHYLTVLLNIVFGAENFRSSIIWKRSNGSSDNNRGKIHSRVHDTILFYTKSDRWTWNPISTPYHKDYFDSEYRHVASDGRRYKETDATTSKAGGDVEYDWRILRRSPKQRWEADLENEWISSPRHGTEYRGVRPYTGRYWAYSKSSMVELARAGQLMHRRTGMPRIIHYADEMPGLPLPDVWIDIPAIGPRSIGHLGYSAQKPEALLERIIMCSSNEGDVVLDPCCGSGTSLLAAQKLKRRWVGIDKRHIAIAFVKSRLSTAFGNTARYSIVGPPLTLDHAKDLADTDPNEFKAWILGLVGALPVGSKEDARGVDGRLYFRDGMPGDKPRQIIVSISLTHVTASQIRDLIGILDREKAAVALVISFEGFTKSVQREARSAGLFQSARGQHPRLQLLTVTDLIEGQQPNARRTAETQLIRLRTPPVLAEQADVFDGHG